MSFIKYPLSTEKTIRLMESNNTLIFVVDKKATKKQIKDELESLYKIKIERINTTIDTKNRKKAYVKLVKDMPAIDLATQLGLM
ncbi:MAG: 50S ribosomal protein L23 [Candidatus Woesearchaeota archaeon]